LELYCASQGITLQYVAPNQHRANKAERTFKNHFIATLSGADPDFPLAAWDLLIPQAELTLNLMRASNVNPFISAYYQLLHGRFNFNKTPLAPPGIKVVIHEKPTQRESWAPHGVDGWYVGPALKSYRCYDVLVKSTRRTRITDTLSWHPRAVSLPGASPIDVLAAATKALTTDLDNFRRTAPELLNERSALHAPLASLANDLASLCDIFLTDDSRPEQRVVALSQSPLITVTHHDSDELARDQRVMPAITQSSPLLPPPGFSASQQQQHHIPPPASDGEAQPLSPRPTSPRRNPSRSRKGPRRYYSAAASQHRRKAGTRSYHRIWRHFVVAAMDIDTEVQPATYRAAMKGPDRDNWLQAHSEEIVRLVEETQCMTFIPHTGKRRGAVISYYNPQLKIKKKNGKSVYRVRGTYGGDRLKKLYAGEKDAQTAALSAKKPTQRCSIRRC